MRLHNVELNGELNNFFFRDDEDTKEWSVSIYPFAFEKEQDDWRIKPFDFSQKERTLLKTVRSTYFIVPDETQRRMAFQIFKSCFKIYDIPAIIRSHPMPNIEAFVIDYSLEFLGDDDIFNYILLVQEAVKDIEVRELEKDEVEETKEEQVTPETVPYNTPFDTIIGNDEFVEDDFELGVVEE